MKIPICIRFNDFAVYASYVNTETSAATGALNKPYVYYIINSVGQNGSMYFNSVIPSVCHTDESGLRKNRARVSQHTGNQIELSN
jgi:hypothetical protein